MKHQTKHGGKRKGAGRKPSPDKKQTVVLYIETSKVEKSGGKNKLIEYIYNHINLKTCNYENFTRI